MRLRTILDEMQAPAFADVADEVHLRGLPVEVHGNDRARAWGDPPLEGRRVQTMKFIDVDEHDARARLGHGFGGRDPAHRGDDHLVAWPDAEHPQHDIDRIRAVGDADTVLRSARPRIAVLEHLHELPADEGGALDYPFHRSVEFGLMRHVLRHQVGEWNAHR